MKGVVKGLIAGGIIIGIGVAILIIGLALNGWKFKGSVKFEMRTFTAQEENSALDIKVRTGSVKTEFYDGDRIVIEYPVAKNFDTKVREKDGKVSFDGLHRKWYLGFWLSYDVPDTIVKLPHGIAYDMYFDVDAGTATLADCIDKETYGNVTVDIDAGSFKSGSVVCNVLKCDIDAGSVKITSAVCNTFNCKIDAGSANIEKLKCNDALINIDAGSVKAGFTGEKEEYSISAKVDAGSCNVTSQSGNTDKKINIDVDAGKIELSFGV